MRLKGLCYSHGTACRRGAALSRAAGISVIDVHIPGSDHLVLEHLVLDVNGTIAAGGGLVPGVAEAVEALAATVHVVAITADTHGTAARLRDALGIEVRVILQGEEGAQKQALVEELGAHKVVAVGNGANDVDMVRAAALGIAVIGAEGAAGPLLAVADVVTTSILDALSLLSQPARIVATLRR